MTKNQDLKRLCEDNARTRALAGDLAVFVAALIIALALAWGPSIFQFLLGRI